MVKINPYEITPEHLYLSRGQFLKMGALAAGAAALAACAGGASTEEGAPAESTDDPNPPKAGASTRARGSAYPPAAARRWNISRLRKANSRKRT